MRTIIDFPTTWRRRINCDCDCDRSLNPFTAYTGVEAPPYPPHTSTSYCRFGGRSYVHSVMPPL